YQLAQVTQLGGDHPIFRRRQLWPLLACALVGLMARRQPREGNGDSARRLAHARCDPVAVAFHVRRRNVPLGKAERAGEDDLPRLVTLYGDLIPDAASAPGADLRAHWRLIRHAMPASARSSAAPIRG